MREPMSSPLPSLLGLPLPGVVCTGQPQRRRSPEPGHETTKVDQLDWLCQIVFVNLPLDRD
ncbi:MAG: hypothetical protein JWR83_28 [Aeromicrobium sp.]|nr:hypothetical protein [Aeromicrobium sp.]